MKNHSLTSIAQDLLDHPIASYRCLAENGQTHQWLIDMADPATHAAALAKVADLYNAFAGPVHHLLRLAAARARDDSQEASKHEDTLAATLSPCTHSAVWHHRQTVIWSDGSTQENASQEYVNHLRVKGVLVTTEE